SLEGWLLNSHCGLAAGHNGYFGLAALPHFVPAVSAECMLLRRDIFEDLPPEIISFSTGAVDLGTQISFVLRNKGLKVLFTPYATVRSYRTTREYALKFQAKSSAGEISREQFLLMTEEFYNPNLSFKSPDFFFAFPPHNLPFL
ncbi:glycosyltransferase family 2 protein, partial [Oligoflexia bacterium]|nr:glycosyltransferase family 2 protein [Oligoflexia bacterium]